MLYNLNTVRDLAQDPQNLKGSNLLKKKKGGCLPNSESSFLSARRRLYLYSDMYKIIRATSDGLARPAEVIRSTCYTTTRILYKVY